MRLLGQDSRHPHSPMLGVAAEWGWKLLSPLAAASVASPRMKSPIAS